VDIEVSSAKTEVCGC